MAFSSWEILGALLTSAPVEGSVPRPPNLDDIELRQYRKEAEKYPGLKRHSESVRRPKVAGKNKNR